MRDKLSIQCSTDSKEKNAILEEYRKHSINVSARVLQLIRTDVKNLREMREGR
ncbi:hypothetical protein KAR91_87105 [Candidatus Pacearchaeota archaeon]|nr:hypothetical protein [Candidatus Pacearchaeota archaeon]